MKSKKHYKDKLLLLIIIIIFFYISSFSLPITLKSEKIKNEKQRFHEKLYPSYENLSHIEIVVDGSDPSKNWSSLTLIPNYEDWFTGDGTWGNPFIIHDVFMEKEEYSYLNCITIKNTNDFFQIVNCLLTRSNRGILLDNVSNGKLFNNNCTYHSSGIELINSHSNIISGNYLYSHGYGITLINSNNNTIYANTLKESYAYGIVLENCDYNMILNNNITDAYSDEDFSSFGGMWINNCNNTLLDQNLITDGYQVGITIIGDNITLLENEVLFNYYGVLIDGTYIDLIGNSVNFNTNTGILCSGKFFNFSKNIISNNMYGISCSSFSNSNISSNEIIDNEYYGIYFEDPENCSLIDNQLDNGGILFSEDNPKIISNRIDDSNTIDGKPVYFYVNKTNLNPNNFDNGGQIILFNCSNVEFSDLFLNNTCVGISLKFCSNILISNLNVSENNYYGIYVKESQNVTILNSNVKDNTINGFYLKSCQNSSIKFNRINSNFENGIFAETSDNITIKSNSINYNIGNGISISGKNAKVIENTINRNKEVGVNLIHCIYGKISGNTIFNNSNHGIALNWGSDNTIIDNIILHHAEKNLADSEYFILVDQYGVYLYSTSDNLIYDNIINYNERGIFIDHSNFNFITENYLVGNSGGISLDYSDYNNITYNTFKLTDECIFLLRSCDGNIIENNNCIRTPGLFGLLTGSLLLYILLISIGPISVITVGLLLVRKKRKAKKLMKESSN